MKTISLLAGVLAANLWAAKLQQLEYFWDTDPGTGAGIALTTTDGAFDQALEESMANPVNQPAGTGAHTLHVRALGQNGWGPVTKYPVFVQANGIPTIRTQPQLAQMEYFWDTDPGVGAGIALTATDGTFDQALEQSLANPANKPVGLGAHTLHVRAKNAAGIWGPVTRFPVFVASPAVLNVADLRIMAMEYYCGKDPGAGVATMLVSSRKNFTSAEGEVQIPSSIVKRGPNLCGVRSLDAKGNWSATQRFTVYGVADSPPYAPVIAGDASVCTDGTLHASQNARYTIEAEHGATYAWTVTGGTTVSSSNSEIVVNWDASALEHQLEVVGSNSYGLGAQTTLEVSLTQLPVVTIAQDGNDLSVPANQDWTYQWTQQGVNIDGATSHRYWVTTDAYYRVKVGTYCGTSTSSEAAVIFDPQQPQPGTSPQIVADSATVAENQSGALLGTLAATGTGGYPVTWSLSDALDAQRYQIDATTGQLKLQTAVSLDYEVRKRDTVSVQLQVGATGATANYDYMVLVQNVNEAPSAVAQSFTFDENQAAGSVGVLQASDPESDPLSWTLVSGNDQGLFQLNLDGTLSTTGPLDYESSTVHLFVVRVSDGSLHQNVNVTVNVGNVAELPSSSSSDPSSSSVESSSSSSAPSSGKDVSSSSESLSSSSVSSTLVREIKPLRLRSRDGMVWFHLERTGAYTLEVYNARGIILQRVEGYGAAGEHSWRLPSSAGTETCWIRLVQNHQSSMQRIPQEF